jgi:hypothetical protein
MATTAKLGTMNNCLVCDKPAKYTVAKNIDIRYYCMDHFNLAGEAKE